MPSQIVFLFDLDGCAPLGEEGESSLIRLVSGILLSESLSSPCLQNKSDLPSFSLRFYSSTGYFAIHEDFDYELKDLSLESYNELEHVLSDRISALRSAYNIDTWKSHLEHNKSRVSDRLHALQSALDILSLHIHWDRPLLQSPLKKNRHSFENAVYVFTSLPRNKAEYRKYYNKTAKSHTIKELSDALFTKNVLQRFKQEISLYVVDLSNPLTFDDDPSIKELFHKTLKPMRQGGLIPFASLLFDIHLSSYLTSYRTFRTKHVVPSSNVVLGGKNVSCFPLCQGKPPWSGGAMILMGLCPMDWFSWHQSWESHHSLRLAGSPEFFRALKNRVCLFKLKTKQCAVLFNGGVLSVLSSEESEIYLDLLEEENASSNEDVLERLQSVIDACLTKEDVAKMVSPSAYPKNNFTDADMETWRLGCDAKEMSKKIKCYKSSQKSWMTLLRKTYGTQQAPSQRDKKSKRGSALMERNDSGFSEGKRSSSSSSLNRRLSDESIGVKTRRGSQPIASRAAELLRLGNQKNAENKRRRSQNKSSKSTSDSFSYPFNDQRTMKRLSFENNMKETLGDEGEELVSQVLAKLMEFQVECINEGDHVSMSALAEITISSLLKHLQKSGEAKTNLVNLVADNFLVDPLTISRRKTSQKMPKRLRDHKLQVLYRMELHWLLSSSEEQEKFENEILIHLRQISIWGSPEEMVSFLNDALTPMYVDRQPELLCSLYDELNQPKADVLRGIFSPSAKSDCSSIAPSSVLSQSSEVSQYSSKNPSLRSLNNKSVANVRKLRRPHSFDQGHIRQIAQPHLKTTARALAKKPTCNIKDRSGPSVTASPSSKGRAGLHRAKRNLSFDGFGKSPRKKPSTPRKKLDTPKKKNPVTPKRMTPNKTHCIYAPETPKNKIHRKSDGLVTIQESPDIDSVKTSKTTPRRMRASLNLYKKTSFYSGDVSRNLMKAEENVNACKIRRTSSQTQPFLDESSCDSTAGYLFQHIIRKRSRPDEEEDGLIQSRRKIRRIENDDAEYEVFSEPSSSPMKTPKKRAFKTPVKESPSPSKRVQFNMQHQPPTPSRGTPAKTILKTPSKEPKTPTTHHHFNSTLVQASPKLDDSKSHLFSNRSMRKKRILFEDSPSKPRLLMEARNSSSTKKKIDFEDVKSEDKEIEIPDSHLTNLVLMSKALISRTEESPNKESPSVGISKILNDSENAKIEKQSNLTACSPDPIVVQNDNVEKKFDSHKDNLKETLQHKTSSSLQGHLSREKTDSTILQPIQLENITTSTALPVNELKNERNAPENNQLKRTNRNRKATQRLGIDDVPIIIIGTPSPVRSTNKLSSKGSGIRRNLFDSDKTSSKDMDENIQSEKPEIRKTSRSRVITQRFGIDDITLDEAVSPVRRNRKNKNKSPVMKVSTGEAVETIVDGLSIRGESDSEPNSNSVSPIKHWSVTNITESPQGEIKLKINRTPKSSFVTQRISRSLVNEIGVSPDRLRRILTDSPSPKRQRSNKEEPSGVPSSSSQKYSPLSSMSLIQLTTSPILDKTKPSHRNRKVNKRLYID